MLGRTRPPEAAGMELALRCVDSLYGAALRLTGESSAAEDLVQETFVRGHRYFRRLTDVDACRAILYKIMLHLWLKSRRRAQREVSLEEMAEDSSLRHRLSGHALISGGEDPEAQALKKSFLVAVDGALQKLPPEFRVTVILADIEGFSYREMADMLQCPLGTVMSRLHRARRFLERQLSSYAEAAEAARTPA